MEHYEPARNLNTVLPAGSKRAASLRRTAQQHCILSATGQIDGGYVQYCHQPHSESWSASWTLHANVWRRNARARVVKNGGVFGVWCLVFGVWCLVVGVVCTLDALH